MIFFDDFTRMMWVAFLKDKFEAFDKFKIFKNRFENESGMCRHLNLITSLS